MRVVSLIWSCPYYGVSFILCTMFNVAPSAAVSKKSSSTDKTSKKHGKGRRKGSKTKAGGEASSAGVSGGRMENEGEDDKRCTMIGGSSEENGEEESVADRASYELNAAVDSYGDETQLIQASAKKERSRKRK